MVGGELFHVEESQENHAENTYWHSAPELVQAVWSLVHICGSEDAKDARALVSDFISKVLYISMPSLLFYSSHWSHFMSALILLQVGIGDPRSVVFHLPGDSSHMHVCGAVGQSGISETNFKLDTVIPDELSVALIRILKKYLMDDSVKIIDLSSQTLRVSLFIILFSTHLGFWFDYIPK